MDFFKNGFCNRRGPHNQGCLFRHDEIEGQGKIETARPEAGREVTVFKAEAMGWNAQAVVKVAYSDMAKAAKEWAKNKEATAQPAATPVAVALPPGPAASQPAAAPAAAPPLPAGWKEAKAPDGRCRSLPPTLRVFTPPVLLPPPCAASSKITHRSGIRL